MTAPKRPCHLTDCDFFGAIRLPHLPQTNQCPCLAHEVDSCRDNRTGIVKRVVARHIVPLASYAEELEKHTSKCVSLNTKHASWITSGNVGYLRPAAQKQRVDVSTSE